jgi:hypothetical protein
MTQLVEGMGMEGDELALYTVVLQQSAKMLWHAWMPQLG